MLVGVLFLAIINQGNVSAGTFVTPAIEAEEPPENPWVNVGNGTRVNITAGNRTHLRTMSGNHIRIQVNECVQLQVTESETNPAGPLLNQTRAVNRYMHVELNGTVLMNATMYRNYTNAELSELGNVSTFRWAFYDEESHQWQYAHHNWIEKSSEGASVVCNTTHFSIWTILAPMKAEEPLNNPTPGVPFNCNNGTGFALQGGNMYKIQTQSGFSLQLQVNKSVEVTITEYEDSPKAMTQARNRIRTRTMSVEMNTSAKLDATFSYQFTNQTRNQLGIQNMTKLRFMFYNETSQEWETPQNQWVYGDTLYCNTTHFSLWTVAEEVDETPGTAPGFELLPILSTLIAVLIISRRK